MNELIVLCVQTTLLLGLISVFLWLGKNYSRWCRLVAPLLFLPPAALVGLYLVQIDPRAELSSVLARLEKVKSTEAESVVVNQSDPSRSSLDRNRKAPGQLNFGQLLNWLPKVMQPGVELQGFQVRRATRTLLIAFMALAGMRLVIGNLHVLRILRNATEMSWPKQLRATMPELANYRVFCLASGASPCVAWLAPKKIFVPKEFESLKRDQQSAIVAHEIAHLRQRDPLVRFLVDCMLSFLSWHPLAWITRRQFVEAQELAADSQAAEYLGDLQVYRCALSRLLLWMDSQQGQAHGFCVSFSTNSTVRRIKMLEKASNKFLNWRFATASICFVALGFLCSAWRIQADDKMRLASAKKSGGSQQKLFDRPASAPWETLGEWPGYVHLRKGPLSESPFTQNMILAYAMSERLINPEAELVLEVFENFESLESNLFATLVKIPVEKQDEGRENSLSLGGNSFDVHFANAIDWAEMIDAINWDSINSNKNIEIVKKGLLESAKSSHLKMHADEDDRLAVSSSQDERIKELWKFVDGGQVTAAIVNPMEENFETKIEDPMDAKLKALATKVDCVVLGFDCDENIFKHNYRLALYPRTSAEELVESIKEFTQTNLDDLQRRLDSGEEDEDYISVARIMWETMEAKVIATQQGEATLVSFTHVLNVATPEAGEKLPLVPSK